MSAGVHIGTSGWHYAHWKGPFYPQDIKKADWLGFYAERFDCVELNNSFYNLPDPQACDAWREQTPAGFRFSVKAWRMITHRKKLKDPEEYLRRFFEPLARLGEKAGPVLFQLPPRWRCNVARLQTFLETLPRGDGQRYAFEFRDPSWHNDEVYAALEAHGAAFCVFELGGMRSPVVTTANLGYVRLHGPDGPYAGSYPRRTLRRWAERLEAWRRKGRDTWLFFDNDEAGYAAKNALLLRDLVDTVRDEAEG